MSGSAAAESQAPHLAFYRLPLGDRKPDQPIGLTQAETAWNEPILRQNGIWFCRLRWMVVTVLGLVGIAGFFPRHLETLGFRIAFLWPLGAAAVLAFMNILFIRMAGWHNSAQRGVPVRAMLWAQITTDLLVLTMVIHWLGSDFPTAPFMYLFHIILACIAFSPGESLLVAGLAAGFYLISLLLESLGVLGKTSVLAGSLWSEGAGFSDPSLLLRVVPMLLVWAVIWYLVSRLAGTVRRRDLELALTNLRLNASIEERAKHLLQTTHQLKAPFAAIHAQTQLLLGNYCGTLPPAAFSIVEKISGRCMALSRQIQEMLQLANLRSQSQTPLPRKRLNVATFVEEAMARVDPAARQRGIRLEKEIAPVTLTAVEDHLTMLLDNLVVNAVNYSYNNGVVEVTCRPRKNGDALVVIRDHGIGIPNDKLPHIFDDYYRTNEAVQHNRTSTGLGLAVVRQVAEEARVEIQVESAPSWGTRFTVTIPNLPNVSEDKTKKLRNQEYGLLVNR